MKRIRKPEYAAINKLIDRYDFGYKWEDHISRPKKDKWLQVLSSPCLRKTYDLPGVE